MTWLELTIWATLMLAGFVGSALYSGMETGAYSLNRIRLQIYHHQHHRSASALRQLLDDPTVLLTTLLIGNNIANYLGTAGLAVILESRGIGQWQAVLLNTLIVTPILFVFGETLPKDLFAAYADRLMYRMAPVLRVSQQVFWWTGLGPLIRAITRLLMRSLGQHNAGYPFSPRRQVQFLVKEGVGYGLLSDDQSAMLERVLGLASRRVGDEMIPWRNVTTVNASASASSLWELAQRSPRSRFPVVNDTNNVVGELNLMDVLRAGDAARDRTAAELMQPPVLLPASMPLRRGLSALRHSRIALAIVTDPQQQPIGIVTMKDLVEAITGELASW